MEYCFLITDFGKIVGKSRVISYRLPAVYEALGSMEGGEDYAFDFVNEEGLKNIRKSQDKISQALHILFATEDLSLVPFSSVSGRSFYSNHRSVVDTGFPKYMLMEHPVDRLTQLKQTAEMAIKFDMPHKEKAKEELADYGTHYLGYKRYELLDQLT